MDVHTSSLKDFREKSRGRCTNTKDRDVRTEAQISKAGVLITPPGRSIYRHAQVILSCLAQRTEGTDTMSPSQYGTTHALHSSSNIMPRGNQLSGYHKQLNQQVPTR